MAYREDVDLEFLSKVSSQDLNPLVKLLTHDPQDNKGRWTEELTGNKKYKLLHPHHKLYWDLIAAELQCFGANTMITLLRRGKGVLYREILIDVCKNQKVNFNNKSETRQIEAQLLAKVLERSWENLTATELDSVVKRF